ncbi:MAG: hypothetical protein HKM93_03045 [Desulfobacteraceae bacterium]|nr:hypothetical protein [Desulfobacteraceae bacterium]
MDPTTAGGAWIADTVKFPDSKNKNKINAGSSGDLIVFFILHNSNWRSIVSKRSDWESLCVPYRFPRQGNAELYQYQIFIIF